MRAYVSLSLSSYCSPYNSPIKIKRQIVGARNNDYLERQQTRRWWACTPKTHLAWVRIQTFFILKAVGVKPNISWFPSTSGRDIFNFFLPAVIHRWDWSELCFGGIVLNLSLLKFLNFNTIDVYRGWGFFKSWSPDSFTFKFLPLV